MKYLMMLLISFNCTAYALDQTSEPRISVFQGTEKGTSVIVVTWPDGVTERLKYNDKDVTSGETGYLNWFNDRYEAYKKRNGLH